MVAGGEVVGESGRWKRSRWRKWSLDERSLEERTLEKVVAEGEVAGESGRYLGNKTGFEDCVYSALFIFFISRFVRNWFKLLIKKETVQF